MTEMEEGARQQKKKPWGWIIGGGIFLALFSGCSFLFVGMFANIREVQPLNTAFISDVFEEGLPRVASGKYSSLSEVTDEGLGPVDEMIRTLGGAEELGMGTCNAQSNASTNEASGQFVMCVMPLQFEATSGRVETTWRKEGDGWMVYRFYLNVTDAEAYNELVAARALADKRASKAELKNGAPAK